LPSSTTRAYFKKPLDSLKSVKFELNPPATVDNFYRKGFFCHPFFAPHTGNNKSDDWQLYSRKSFGVITTEQVNEKKSAKEIENNLLLNEISR